MSDDKRLDRIEIKVDKVLEHQSEINVTLAAQHVSLKEHIRRTNILETELKPIKQHVQMIHGAFKLLGIIVASVGVAEALIALIAKLNQ